jgi:hypothetical protein
MVGSTVEVSCACAAVCAPLTATVTPMMETTDFATLAARRDTTPN